MKQYTAPSLSLTNNFNEQFLEYILIQRYTFEEMNENFFNLVLVIYIGPYFDVLSSSLKSNCGIERKGHDC